jgi:hypothetical protein
MNWRIWCSFHFRPFYTRNFQSFIHTFFETSFSVWLLWGRRTSLYLPHTLFHWNIGLHFLLCQYIEFEWSFEITWHKNISRKTTKCSVSFWSYCFSGQISLETQVKQFGRSEWESFDNRFDLK